jgi:hypothetical protein
MTTENIIFFAEIVPPAYDAADLIERVATNRPLSGGQNRWLETCVKSALRCIIEQAGGNAGFSKTLHIPKRTVENWNSEGATGRCPPDYNVRIYAERLRELEIIN